MRKWNNTSAAALLLRTTIGKASTFQPRVGAFLFLCFQADDRLSRKSAAQIPVSLLCFCDLTNFRNCSDYVGGICSRRSRERECEQWVPLQAASNRVISRLCVNYSLRR